MHILFGCPVFLHYDYGYISLVHHFFHANIFHLAINCLSIWTLFRKDLRYDIAPLMFAYLIGTASWFFTSSDVVGFSNFIFALIGLRTPSIRNAWWRHPSVITFFVMTILMAFLPNVSAVTHVVSFVMGSGMAGAHRIFSKIRRDYSRASYC